MLDEEGRIFFSKNSMPARSVSTGAAVATMLRSNKVVVAKKVVWGDAFFTRARN